MGLERACKKLAYVRNGNFSAATATPMIVPAGCASAAGKTAKQGPANRHKPEPAFHSSRAQQTGPFSRHNLNYVQRKIVA